MLKSLLYQALIRTPLLVTKTLAEIYANKTESLGTPGIKWEWDQEELKRHFQEIMWKTASWSQTVVVFVDALDECEEFNSVVSYFQTDLLPKSIHVLVSSRLEPSISGANKVRLDENNQADIQTYIRSQLLDSRFSSETIWISQIIDEADGCFLWVKLVLAHSDFSAFGTNEIIWLPHNLEEAYRLIMSRTMAGDSHLRQKYARKILRLITYTLRPVTIEELWDGLALGHSKLSSVYGDLEEAKLLPHSSNSISNAASMVEYVSGGLLEVVDLDLVSSIDRRFGTPSKVVSFLHCSVKEYLQRTEAWGETSVTAHGLHLEIALECFDYLQQIHSGAVITKETALGSRPFLHYALFFGMQHLRMAMEFSISPFAYGLSTAWEILTSDFLNYWISVFDLGLEDHPMFQYQKTVPLHVLSYFNLQPPDKRVLESMLENLDRQDHDGRTPLSVAATMGHQNMCQLLILMGADCSIRDNMYGLTPLGWAAAYGHIDVAKLLLECGSDIDDCVSGYSALHIALRLHQTDMVDLLIAHGADISVKDKYSGQTVLSLAASIGHVPTVDLLLSCGADIMSKDDGTGWTAFHHAISKGHKRTLAHLFDALREDQVDLLEAHLNETGPHWVKRLSLKSFLFATSCHGSNESTSTTPTQAGFLDNGSSTNSSTSGNLKSSKRRYNDFPDSDDEEQEDDLNRSRKISRQSAKDNKRLACPYHQRCPEIYSSGACNGTGFENMNRLKLSLSIIFIVIS